MKDLASAALFPNPSRLAGVWEATASTRSPHHSKHHPPFSLVRHICRGWKLAEGIPSHGAPDLSITFQLANELQHHKGSSRSQPGRAEPAGPSTSSQTAMKLTEYNQITISDPSNGSSCEAGPPDGR